MKTPTSKLQILTCPPAPLRLRLKSFAFSLRSNRQRAAFETMIRDNPTMAAFKNSEYYLVKPMWGGCTELSEYKVIMHDITEDQAECVLITLACYGCFLNEGEPAEWVRGLSQKPFSEQ